MKVNQEAMRFLHKLYDAHIMSPPHPGTFPGYRDCCEEVNTLKIAAPHPDEKKAYYISPVPNS